MEERIGAREMRGESDKREIAALEQRIEELADNKRQKTQDEGDGGATSDAGTRMNRRSGRA